MGGAAVHRRPQRLAGARAAGSWQPAEGGASGQSGGHSRGLHESTAALRRSVCEANRQLENPHHATGACPTPSRTLARSKSCWSCCAIYSACGNKDRTKNGGKQARICSPDAAAKPAYCAPRRGRSCPSSSLHDAFVSSATAQPCPARSAVQHLAAAPPPPPSSRSLC